ncbi:hypothetical protein [Novosphingobium sp. CF614]|uniref:hypothetical protein n=1 Tax=Novosphingobium sp. CF614 TaxID=1884364 RepID=UPI0015A589CB|nr:hypothetical protein [Novosphingobium sp. CF614]
MASAIDLRICNQSGPSPSSGGIAAASIGPMADSLTLFVAIVASITACAAMGENIYRNPLPATARQEISHAPSQPQKNFATPS